MGMQVGKAGGIKNDINVTPLIDVVLVLLIIFLVTLPLMMKTITLVVPRKIDLDREFQSSDVKNITILVKSDLSVELDTGDRVIPAKATDVAANLKPLLEGKEDKLVFVDFEDPVPWEHVVLLMDAIRGVATDSDHNDVKVALKIKDKPGEGAAQP